MKVWTFKQSRKHLHGNRRKRSVSSCWWFPLGDASFPWCPPGQTDSEWTCCSDCSDCLGIRPGAGKKEKSSRFKIQAQFATCFLLQALEEIKVLLQQVLPSLQNGPVGNTKLHQVSVYLSLHEHLKLTIQRTILHCCGARGAVAVVAVVAGGGLSE